MIKLISFIVFTHFFPISMNLKFEGNQVTYYFKLKQQYFFFTDFESQCQNLFMSYHNLYLSPGANC